MTAVRIHYSKAVDDSGGIEERVIWAVPKSVKYPQGVRYRLAYVRANERRPVVLYDNHYPKGHHRHLGESESPYAYSGVERLLEDFRQDVEGARWKH